MHPAALFRPLSRRRARLAATALAFTTTLLALARTPARAATSTSAPDSVIRAGADPCSLLFGSMKTACENAGKPGTGSNADPCAALFGSMKTACENAGKNSGSGGGTSLLDIPGQVEQAIDTWFGDLVKAALTPILNLFGRLVLATPNLSGGRIAQIWQVTLGVTDTCFVLFAVIGGVIVMTHDSVQSRHGFKQILPRLIFGFIAANTSLLIVGQVMTFANALTLAIWGTPVSGTGIGNKLLGYLLISIVSPDGATQTFLILIGLVVAGLALAVVFSLALRSAGLLVLTIFAPAMLACHALPGLDEVARLWWRALAAICAIEILQAGVLMLTVQVFFDPDGNILGVPTGAGLIDLVVCGALFVILLKIPGWVLRMVLGRAPRSTVAGLLRTAAAAAIGTTLGVPGTTTSLRSLGARLTGRAVRSRLHHPAPNTARARATRPAAARFGTAHGRPGPGGQGALFPIPRGACSAPRVATTPANSAASGSPPTSGPGWVQPPLFANPANFGTAHGRPGPGGQGALFPVPPGARQPSPPGASTAVPTPLAPSNGPNPGPGWVQPGLFPNAIPGPIRGRQHALFPVPPGAKKPGPAPPPPVTPAARPAAPTGDRGPRFVQPGLFPPSGRVPPTPTARLAGAAPLVPGRTPQPPPQPGPRLIPVRMATTPPPARKRGRARKPNPPKRGE